jgi:hypothetical protein
LEVLKAVRGDERTRLAAGILDLSQACILFGSKIPLAIAAGLIGSRALHGGAAIYILGVILHVIIAFSAAATTTV